MTGPAGRAGAAPARHRLRRAAGRVRDGVRRMPPTQLALRGVLVGSGGLALLVAPGGRLVVSGLLALLAVPALVVAAARPDGAGPAVVLGAAAAAWTTRYGVAAAPLGTTLALAAALYLHHLTAALLAGTPPAAAVDADVLARWGAHAALVLGVTGGIAALAGALGRPGPSVPLELAGIGVALALAAVLVLLARRP